MKNNNMVLLKTLLLSTSQINIWKHTSDKKKKSKIVGSFIGLAFIYLMIMGYCVANCIGYGILGIANTIPTLCALSLSAIAFLFTFFKTNGYLFNFKEYDMLMALPFASSTVAGCKFLYMYVKTLPWYLTISISMMIGYGIYVKPSIIVYPLWLVLSLLVPIIPMLFASFCGFLIARISTGFKKNNIIQTILTFIFVIFCFSLRFIIESIFRNNQVEDVLEQTSEMTENAARIYMPAGWFSNAVTKLGLSDIFLLVGVTVFAFAIVFKIVGRSYRNINSALKSHAASKKYKMTVQKRRSVINAIAYKEFKRLTGSTTYMVNSTVGELLALILGVVTLIIGFEKIVRIVIQDAPIDTAILQPAIPFIAYFLVGMMTTTACSPSLEGKNYWILQSLPIKKETIYKGKMLFNMYLTIPFMSFLIICLCISARVPFVNSIFYLLLGFILCAFSTAWGCVCGIKHMRLDWENETEVVKQGAAVAIYMFPNMFVALGLTVLVVYLGLTINHILLTLLLGAIVAVLALICYLRALKLAARTQ